MKEKIIEAPDLSKVLNKSHDDKWVAFSANYKKVLAASKTIGGLIDNLGEDVIKSEKPVFYKVLSSKYTFSPNA